MKKKIVIAVIMLFYTLTSIKVWAQTGEASTANVVPNLQFPVMSDLHLGNDRENKYFLRALNDFKNIAPNYNAIALVGDITNHGLESQYNQFNTILNNNISGEAEKLVTIGNHEFYEGKNWPKPELTDKALVNRFIDKTGMPGLYYDKWIKGYHFIVLGSEESRVTNESNEDKAIISDNQYKWLEKTLAVNASSQKPIFVFLHQAIEDTVYGSEYYGGGLRDGRLFNILKQYPQVVFFSGHSHFLVNHPRTVNQNGFTQVNTGSVAYSWYEGGDGASQFSQGLLVNVYDDKLEIKTREFTTGKFISSYTVDIPYSGKITDGQKPVFPDGAEATVDSISGNEVSISWNKAVDNTIVDKYYIKVNGEIIDTKYVDFWSGADSNRLYAKIGNLSNGSKYIFDIIAVDAWKNESYKGLQVKVDIPRMSGWIKLNGYWYYYLPDTGGKKVGWLYEGGYWYYLDSQGKMKIGWIYYGDKWYFLTSSGAMKVGWLYDNGKWYYLEGSGSMKTGWLYSGGKWYYLQSNGSMAIGWIYTGGKWYYLSGSGAMMTGWIYDSGKWYYLNSSGAWIY